MRKVYFVGLHQVVSQGIWLLAESAEEARKLAQRWADDQATVPVIEGDETYLYDCLPDEWDVAEEDDPDIRADLKSQEG